MLGPCVLGVRGVCGIEKLHLRSSRREPMETIAINSTRTLAQRVDYNNRYIYIYISSQGLTGRVARLPNVLQSSQTNNSLHKPNIWRKINCHRILLSHQKFAESHDVRGWIVHSYFISSALTMNPTSDSAKCAFNFNCVNRFLTCHWRSACSIDRWRKVKIVRNMKIDPISLMAFNSRPNKKTEKKWLGAEDSV